MRSIRWIVIVCGLLCLLAGCTDMGLEVNRVTPESKLVAARQAYDDVSAILDTAIEGDKFAVDEAQMVIVTRRRALQMLNRWEAAMQLGQPYAEFADDWRALLLELTAYAIQAQRS